MNTRTFPERKGCLVIGEVAQAHEGSVGMAHAYIDAIAAAGAGAVKFQTHMAAQESTPAEPWRVKFSKQDKTRFDYWKRMEFAVEHWRGLREHARDCSLLFIVSPFSDAAVDLLDEIDVDAWKIASGEVSNSQMLEHPALKTRPVLMSTGMSSWKEIDQSVKLFRKLDLDMTLLQCTSLYPTPPEKVGLNVIGEMRERYRCPVGLSDHSGMPEIALAAAAEGIDVLEVHVTFDKRMFGPDVAASLTIDELQRVVQGISLIETAKANPVDKDEMSVELADLRKLFTKSVVAARELPEGHVLTRHDMAVKKPGTGLPAVRLAELVGKRLLCAIPQDGQILEEHLA